jgi:Caspase domain
MKMISIIVVLAANALSSYAQETKARTEKIRVKVGGQESRENLTMADLGVTKMPKYHALIIGISDYQKNSAKLSDLEKPVQDAERLYNVLTTKYTFNTEDVIFLKNPTYKTLNDTLLHLADKVGQNENLLIFYAGHGYYDKQREAGYWIPSDATMDSRSNWITNTKLRDDIGALKQAKHALLITDACFGGSIFKGSRGAYETNLIMRFKEAYGSKSRKAITSGNLSEVPDQSLFIEQLIKKLDENNDPYITSFSIFNKIYEILLNNSETSPKYGAIQGVGDEGGDFVFIKR